MKKEITNATAQIPEINIHNKKKKKKDRRRKVDSFPTLVINIDQYMNEALNLLIHPIT